MAETLYDPHTRLWQARITRDGRMYLGVGKTRQEAIQHAERKASNPPA